MLEKISVIIPIYKVELYLEMCLNSVINQTYKELEIILVDDGSPDKCGEICDSFAAKDSRIVVIHKENGGLSDARNAGLNIATGEYVTFIDSDDVIASDMIEYLYEMLSEIGADIAVCQSETFLDQLPRACKQDLHKEKINETQKCLEYYFKTNNIQSVAWGKLYKMWLFENIRYPVGKIHEDEFTTYRLIALSKKVIVGFEKKYYYRTRLDSIMNSNFSTQNLDMIVAASERKEFIENEFPELSIYARSSSVHAANCCVIKLILSDKIVKEYRLIVSQLQDLYHYYEKDFLRGPNSIKAKCFSVFAYFNLNMWIWICRKILLRKYGGQNDP